MGDQTTQQMHPKSPRGLRYFDWALQLVTVIAFTLLLVLPVVGVLGSSGTVPVKLDPPYSVCWGRTGQPPAANQPTIDGPCPAAPGTARAVTVESSNSSANYGDEPVQQGINLQPTVTDNVAIPRHDTDARVAYVVIWEVLLALAGLGALLLHWVVGSARERDPFTAKNVRRLRSVAGIVASFWIVTRVGAAVVDAKLDRAALDPSFRVTAVGLGIWS
jgi:hypothetical protein